MPSNLSYRGADRDEHTVQEEGHDVCGEHPGAEKEHVEVQLFCQGNIRGPHSSHCLSRVECEV